jgi:hypothetical protein
MKRVLVIILGFTVTAISYNGCEEKKSESIEVALRSDVYLTTENKKGIQSFFIVEDKVKIISIDTTPPTSVESTIYGGSTVIEHPTQPILTISYVDYYMNKDTIVIEEGNSKFFFKDGKIIWQFECDTENTCKVELIPASGASL